LTSLENRALREKLFNHSWTRTEKGDTTIRAPSSPSLRSCARKRPNWLGYPQLRGLCVVRPDGPDTASGETFIRQLVPATRAKAVEEARLIQAVIDKEGKPFGLKPWDWQRYAEKVRKERYDLDQDALKPYFELNKVLKDGVFYAAPGSTASPSSRARTFQSIIPM